MTVTLDTLHLVFSAFGLVQKIATFEKGQGFQALVQYSDPDTAEQVWLILSGKPPSAPVLASLASWLCHCSCKVFPLCAVLRGSWMPAVIALVSLTATAAFILVPF